MALTLYEKIFNRHVVEQLDDAYLIYIDRHLVHEVTSPQAFEGLRVAQRPIWRKDSIVAVPDHNVPTTDRDKGITDPVSKIQVDTLNINCEKNGLTQFKMDDPRQGIVHVIGPEQGLTLPGMTIVCGDSHTSTHGAFGALAMGIGTSEVEHVLATQCLIVKKFKTLKINVTGEVGSFISAKDIALYVIGQIGTAGGTGFAI
ncbi:MAG: aconitase family protein, partial [Methylophilaceae bacterium]